MAGDYRKLLEGMVLARLGCAADSCAILQLQVELAEAAERAAGSSGDLRRMSERASRTLRRAWRRHSQEVALTIGDMSHAVLPPPG